MELSRELKDRIREGVWEFMEKIDIAEEMADADLLHDQLADVVIDVLEAVQAPLEPAATPAQVELEPAAPDARRVTLANLMMNSSVITEDQFLRERFGNWLAEGPPKPPPKDLGYSTPQVLGTLLAAVLVFGGAVAAGGLLSQWLVTR
jgi:hypothetical protein